ncbi:MAG TPA: hypothetical protein VLV81_02095 [Acidimicrobiia bacterium]|nr:hypothetical protein [Acidimicrobiia bacterium]
MSITIQPRTLVIALAVTTITGMGARGLIASPPGAPRAARTVWSGPGPGTVTAGVPTGFAHSEPGVVAAATTYVRQGQRLFDLPTIDRPAALQAIASRSGADAYVADVSAQLAELDGIAAHGAGHLTWDVSVLATRVDAYSAQRARVSIWRVGVLSVTGLTSPIAEWTTVEDELVWERADWKIWAETQIPGPTPAGHPDERAATPNQLHALLAGFTRYPGPDPL